MIHARTRKKFFGKYRGIVEMNADPDLKGRITAMVPDVLGPIPTTWALPCLANAGVKSGVHVIPAVALHLKVRRPNERFQGLALALNLRICI